jgi:hypothetical protein
MLSKGHVIAVSSVGALLVDAKLSCYVGDLEEIKLCFPGFPAQEQAGPQGGGGDVMDPVSASVSLPSNIGAG